jgi:hypothetical protein
VPRLHGGRPRIRSDRVLADIAAAVTTEGFDRNGSPKRPSNGGGDAPIIAVRVWVRIAVDGHADAVAVSQGHALRALLATLTGDEPRPDPDDGTEKCTVITQGMS